MFHFISLWLKRRNCEHKWITLPSGKAWYCDKCWKMVDDYDFRKGR